MIKLSLDTEPPPRFRGEKEVNRKKSRNLSQLIFSVGNEKNKYKNPVSAKDTGKPVKQNGGKYSSEINYSSLEKYFSEENKTSTLKNIVFSKPESTGSNTIIQEPDYLQGNEERTSSDKIMQNFYEFNPSYSFMINQISMKDSGKKEIPYSESKGQEEKDSKNIVYTLESLEEERKNENEENNLVKWTPGAYS